MNASNRFTRRLAAAVVVAFGLAASQAAYASPPDPTPLKAFDSGQQLRENTELIVQQFDTGQATIVATDVIQKATDLGIAYAPKELDTSPQLDTTAASLVITPVANIDANAGTTPPIDTSPQLDFAVLVNTIVGTIAARAPQKELDTSPSIGGQLAVISGALGIDNTDTGQPVAGHAGFQVLALSA
jgi:hypothetical protein